MEEYKLYLVGEKLYHFFWHTYADIILEECKKDLNDSAKYTLVYLLKEQLKALHPFMPFITEEIWGLIHEEKPEKLLIIEAWPE
jgi:valyl-tRNA synthetase